MNQAWTQLNSLIASEFGSWTTILSN